MKSPAFSFYVRDWLCSKTVNKLHSASLPNGYETSTTTPNLRSRGVAAYVFLLCQAWLEEPPATLPNDDDELAAMARISRKEWDAIKPLLMPALKLDASTGRLYSERQMEEYNKQQNRSKANTKNVRTRYETPTKCELTLENANANEIRVPEGGVGGNPFPAFQKDEPPAVQAVNAEAEQKPLYTLDYFLKVHKDQLKLGNNWTEEEVRTVYHAGAIGNFGWGKHRQVSNVPSYLELKITELRKQRATDGYKQKTADRIGDEKKIAILSEKMKEIEDIIPTGSAKEAHPALVAELKALIEQKKALEQSMFHQ